jgi:superfamily II DNA or RNA helicase
MTLQARPYQEQAIEFLRKKKKALLFDQPGLGKTVEAILAAQGQTPVLIAAPSYWLDNWYSTIYNHISRDVVIADGTRQRRLEALNSSSPYKIINHDMFRTYELPPANTLIVDESHQFRGRKAARTQSVFTYSARTPNVYLLSATPIYKDADDLWPQLHMIDPRTFSSYWKFVSEFCVQAQTPFGIKIIGTKNRAALVDILNEYGLGRTYDDVQMQLPPLIETTLITEFTPEQRRMYDKLRRNYILDDITFDSAPQVLHLLRKLTVTPEKLDALSNLTEEIINSQLPTEHHNQIVIFCWYKETAEILSNYLPATQITGDTEPHLRAQLATNSKLPIVATLASMSEGVDLSFARYAIFFEEDYTPGRMYQALSRVRRATSEHDSVFAYYMHVKQSVDEVIHATIHRRETSIRNIVMEALR